MTSLSTIGTNLYVDLVTTLKPQTHTLSVDGSSLGLQLAGKSTVQEEEEQNDLSQYYTSLYESALFKEVQAYSPVVSSDSVVNTLLGTGVNAQEAVYIKNALNEYYLTNAPRECTTVEVDV